MQDVDIDAFGQQIATLLAQLLELRPKLAIALTYARPGTDLSERSSDYADLIIDVAAGNKLVSQCLEAIAADDPATRLPQFCRDLLKYEDTDLSVEEKLNHFMGQLMTTRDRLRDMAQEIHIAADLQASRFLKDNNDQSTEWLEEQLRKSEPDIGPSGSVDNILPDDELRSAIDAYDERVHDQDQLVDYLLQTEAKLIKLQDAISEITDNRTSVPELHEFLMELRYTLNTQARNDPGRQ